MPCLGLRCRICLMEFPFVDEAIGGRTTVDESALDHFEYSHADKYTLNRDFVYSIAFGEVRTNNDPRRNGLSVTASMVGGCWREAALKRTVGWWLDPMMNYMALEGTLIHESLLVPFGWEREITYVPRAILDGMVIGGTVDRLNRKDRIVRDIKSHKAPAWKWRYPTTAEKQMGLRPSIVRDTKVYPPGEGETLQVNVLMRLVETDLSEVDRPPYRGEIVAIFKGADPSVSNRLLQVPRLSDEDLIARIRPHYDEFQSVMSEPDYDKRLARISLMELEGRHMFNSRDGSCKCSKYCSLKGPCDELLPEELRF